MKYATLEELASRVEVVQQSPRNGGVLELIVCRPQIGTRELVSEGTLSCVEGLVGDTWLTRGSSHTSDGAADPETQLTIMNSRAAALVAGSKDRWPLAGDQLYVDFDLSVDNLPLGSQLAIGGAVVVVTAQPHTGCKKFAERFGADAVRFVNSTIGKELNLRGINARIVSSGPIRVGDSVSKIATTPNFEPGDE